jgi:hypothetical protein
MEAHHMKVHALRINRVPADIARHSADRLWNRLFQQRLGSLRFMMSSFVPPLAAFWPFATLRWHYVISMN